MFPRHSASLMMCRRCLAGPSCLPCATAAFMPWMPVPISAARVHDSSTAWSYWHRLFNPSSSSGMSQKRLPCVSPDRRNPSRSLPDGRSWRERGDPKPTRLGAAMVRPATGATRGVALAHWRLGLPSKGTPRGERYPPGGVCLGGITGTAPHRRRTIDTTLARACRPVLSAAELGERSRVAASARLGFSILHHRWNDHHVVLRAIPD